MSLRHISGHTNIALDDGAEEQDQDQCPICEGRGWVKADVSLADPAFGKAIPCQCQEKEFQEQRLARVQQYSNLELEMLRRMTFETFDVRGNNASESQRETLEAAKRAAMSFARQPHGWLVLAGGNGCGKTHLAVAIASERIGAGELIFFSFVPDLLDHLRSTFIPTSEVTYDEFFERVKTTPLLILDDLGAQRSSPWAEEKLYQIVVHRHNARLPTVITTTRLIDDPSDPRVQQDKRKNPEGFLSEAISSRLNDISVVAHIGITAPDFRPKGVSRPKARQVGDRR